MYVTIPSKSDAGAFPAALCESARLLPETRLGANAFLYREGDKVARIYQISSGIVSLSRHLLNGRRQVIAFGFPGDIVGFPHRGRHHTDCEALTSAALQPYRLSQVTGDSTDPELRAGFLNAAMEEIAGMQDHFMMLGRKSASEKLASFLLVLANRAGTSVGQYTQVHIPMSRADIADFLGLTTETVSRTLTQFRRSRVIALDGAHTVILLRPEALRSQMVGCAD